MTELKQKQPDTLAALARYVFFMRFSFLIWFSLILLFFVDVFTGAKAVTRVLVTMWEPWQILYSTFYTVLAGWQALLAARIVCAYGHERFCTPPPVCLRIKPGVMSWKVFILAQVPGMLLLADIYWQSYPELKSHLNIDSSIAFVEFFGIAALGFCFAFAFWYVLAYIYAAVHPGSSLGAMNAFLTPVKQGLLGQLLQDAAERSPGYVAAKSLEILSQLFASSRAGYVKDGVLYPGQYFALLLLLGLVCLHFTLAFISYPLPRGRWDFAYDYVSRSSLSHKVLQYATPGLICISLSLACFFSGILLLKKNRIQSWRFCHGASVVLAALWVVVAREPAFPSIATILVLMSGFLSLLAGIAYALDRYRIPALVPLLLVILIFQTFSHPDHIFFAAHSGSSSVGKLKLPQEFLSNRSPDRPWIVITATGGGIHSAVWTSTVLAQLEEAFCATHSSSAGLFHNNILLLSSASGGSIAVANWMREYAYGGAFSTTAKTCVDSEVAGKELRGAASTPSVGAAAWGLLHYDLYRAILPFVYRRNWQDRGWFLEQSFLLNRFNAHAPPGRVDPILPNDPAWNQPPTLLDLAKLPPELNVPAFALNATSTDSGERYVLGNYGLPDAPANYPSGILGTIRAYDPALSYLSQFPGCDLSVLVAARLSATFPYVSPTTQLDSGLGPCNRRTEHLADGGYYDNDGVASAAEFLWLAFSVCLPKKPEIWLIQIRDSPLPNGPQPRGVTGKAEACGPFCESVAPLATLYSSGHVADPERNQRDLAVLNAALHSKANLHTVVFDYSPPKLAASCGAEQKADASLEDLIASQEKNWTTLNWLLSTKDECQIKKRWCDDFQQKAVELAKQFHVGDSKEASNDFCGPEKR